MRVVFVTQDDPFYTPLFFERALERLPSRITVESIVLFEPFGDDLPALARRMYELYGPVDFFKRGLQYASRVSLDALGVGTYSVERVATRHGIPTVRRDTVNEQSFVDRLEGVDVLFSVGSPEIFEPDVIDAPRWGSLNVHTAALPEYRGMMPTFWALYHGDEEIGVTVHTMTEEIDEGKAVRRDSFEVSPDDSLDDVICRGKRHGADAAVAALTDVADDEVDPTPITGEGSYFSFPGAEDRRKLKRDGRELL